MKEAAKNAMRSVVVVIGAVSFGYLTLQLGFKPFLEKANALHQSQSHDPSPDNHFDIAQRLPDADSGRQL